jgi:L-arabinose isomerase
MPAARITPASATGGHHRDAAKTFAAIAGIELAVIDAKTELEHFRRELQFGEVYHALAKGFHA